MSCSDPNMKCKDFVFANFGDNRPTHWFASIEDQIAQKPCELHKFSRQACACAPAQVDLLMAGAPCHPYSTQRSQRFSSGSVQDHHEFDVTFESLSALLLKTEPRACVSEQVEGFDMPFTKGSEDTPLRRQEGSRAQRW